MTGRFGLGRLHGWWIFTEMGKYKGERFAGNRNSKSSISDILNLSCLLNIPVERAKGQRPSLEPRGEVFGVTEMSFGISRLHTDVEPWG